MEDNGVLKWKFLAGGWNRFTTFPVIGPNGGVYVGADAHKFYAIKQNKI